MLDPRRLRTDLDGLKAGLGRRGVAPADVDAVAALDEHQRLVASQRDEVRARIRELSRTVAAGRKAGDAEAAEAATAASRALGDDERTLSAEAEAAGAALRDALLNLPNLPAPDCPDGESPADNVIVRVEGYDSATYRDHQRVPHWEIGSRLGLLDLERGAMLSGSMFPLFRGLGAALVRALCQLALDRNVDAYLEVRPPTLVRTDTMVSTGHLPKFADDAYHVERDDLWPIPTAEVPLTSWGRDDILLEADLPLKLMAHTSCFRREAGAAGRDTRGLLRVHEFDKVELLAYATPGQAADAHADILERAEASLRALGLAYRVVDLCTGDLPAPSMRTFDLEVYAPGCDLWLEASSVSRYADYQARRANARYRPAGGGSPVFVHTLNGSALAVPRVWAAVVETYRQPDGSISVPTALQPYMRGTTVIPVASPRP